MRTKSGVEFFNIYSGNSNEASWVGGGWQREGWVTRRTRECDGWRVFRRLGVVFTGV